MRKHLICGTLFDGLDETAKTDQTVVIDDDRIAYVGPSGEAPVQRPGEEVVDHSAGFAMPGLIDIHVHLSYGDAQANEDIDIFSPAGIPGAARAPRRSDGDEGGLYLDRRPGLDRAHDGRRARRDQRRHVRRPPHHHLWTPDHRAPGARRLVPRPGSESRRARWACWCATPTRPSKRIRMQVKDRVDFVKIALDGLHRKDSDGELMACFNQREMDAMVEESHRLGRKVITHARGREAVLTSARAGVDVIFHAFEMDEEGLDAVLESGSVLSPRAHLRRQHGGVHPAVGSVLQVAAEPEPARDRRRLRDADQGA